MRRYVLCIVFIAVITFFLTFSVGLAANPKEYDVSPKTKPGGKKWRIGYLEGGCYGNYQLYLKEIVGALGDLGWVQKVTIPAQKDPEDTSQMWAWIAVNVKSDYLVFVPDAYYSAKWDKTLREKIKTTV
ncbi:MAG: hypothetical protein JW902_02385, partial [Syntrophaceae bacterium]|nr:hypothetical protein [Syntrophaceae bacterium]